MNISITTTLCAPSQEYCHKYILFHYAHAQA